MLYVMCLVGPLTWVLELIVSGILWLLGFPLCGWFAYREQWYARTSLYFNRTILVWSKSWMWLWGNEENGVAGPLWYAQENPTWSQRWRAFVWSAWRNPTCNLRFMTPFGFLIDPRRVRYVGNTLDPDADYLKDPSRTLYYFAWCGWYSGFWLIYRGFQLRVGWKIIPKDKDGLAATDYRRKGCGAALQLQKK